MLTLRVADILKDPILVSRESARELEAPLRTMMTNGGSADNGANFARVCVDFEGVAGIAPSFLDELILVLESLFAGDSACEGRSIVIAHPPTRLSSKFEAVARGHTMTATLLADGSWLISDNQDKRS